MAKMFVFFIAEKKTFYSYSYSYSQRLTAYIDITSATVNANHSCKHYDSVSRHLIIIRMKPYSAPVINLPKPQTACAFGETVNRI